LYNAAIMEPRMQYAKTSDGVNIAYWTMGQGGEPLLILSPLPSATSGWSGDLRRCDPGMSIWRGAVG
jgi:hypothetical protein